MKSFIWPFINRLSHILLILFFALAYILSGFDKLIKYHGAFGLLVGVIFFFRFFWGYIGPKYSKFKDFDFSFSHLKEYMFSVIWKKKEYIGHNPASSFAIIAMMVFTVLALLSGLIAYGIDKDLGLFSFFYSQSLHDMKIFKEIHAILANILVGIVVIHICGALIEKFVKKGDAIDSMITGYKQTSEDKSVHVNFFQSLYALLWIVGIMYSIYYLFFASKNIFLG